ncbi:MAG: GNAT family N-acetyltransferase [Pseudomonadota bacterium]
MSDIFIRLANEDDCATILHFIVELARYEKAEHEVVANEEDIKTAIFSKEATVDAIICELNQQPIGFAVYFYNFSTWLGKKGIYLEDLYVTPAQRGIGAGIALMRFLASKAIADDCGRFEWAVLDWNTPSIAFYESIGAKPKSEWVGYQLTGNALRAFAHSGK